MGVQDLTVQMVVIVVIGVFFASFMDAIAGGGGIISVPTYLLAGLPMHFALGTNKFSSSIGTAFSTGRYIKNGYVDWKLGIPSIVLALIGSFFGTKLQLMISEVYSMGAMVLSTFSPYMKWFSVSRSMLGSIM